MTYILTTRIKEDTSFAPIPRGLGPRQRRMERPQIAVLPSTLAGISIFAGLTPKALGSDPTTLCLAALRAGRADRRLSQFLG